MNLKDFSTEVENILVDEELLRLLHYTPTNGLDDPLEVSSTKPNILDKPDDEKWDIIRQHLVSAVKEDDLEDKETCRIFYFAGAGRRTNSSHMFTNQEYVFEVLVYYDFQIYDKRLEMICDRINKLVFEKRIGGIGKTLPKYHQPIINAPKNYLGFRLVYEFVNENY